MGLTPPNPFFLNVLEYLTRANHWEFQCSGFLALSGSRGKGPRSAGNGVGSARMLRCFPSASATLFPTLANASFGILCGISGLRN